MTPASSEDRQEETPMEQEPPKGEQSSEDTSEKNKTEEDAAEHTKMPEHPGRDSDSDGEDSAAEQEQ